MAQNFATKYASKVDERFKLASVTEGAVNQDYDWSGVKTVQVYSVDTVDLVDYTRSGTSRYGTPDELGTSLQELTLSRDRAFNFTVDRGNYTEEQMVTESGRALRRQIDEVVIPEIDIYRLSVMSDNATTVVSDAITASNAYETVLDLNEDLDNKKVPRTNRLLFASASAFKHLKQDDSFLLASELSQDVKFNGQVGEVDGNAVIRVPSSYLPDNVDMILTHPSATVSPKKIEDYKTHDNPPGVNGWLIEGRLIYDAFVLDNKADAIAKQDSTA